MRADQDIQPGQGPNENGATAQPHTAQAKTQRAVLLGSPGGWLTADRGCVFVCSFGYWGFGVPKANLPLEWEYPSAVVVVRVVVDLDQTPPRVESFR